MLTPGKGAQTTHVLHPLLLHSNVTAQADEAVDALGGNTD